MSLKLTEVKLGINLLRFGENPSDMVTSLARLDYVFLAKENSK